MAWVPVGVLVLGQSRGMVSTSALCLRIQAGGMGHVDLREACALRHSCRDLLAKGGFRLCQEPCIIVLYTYIIYFPRRVRVRGVRRRGCSPHCLSANSNTLSEGIRFETSMPRCRTSMTCGVPTLSLEAQFANGRPRRDRPTRTPG